MEKNDLLEMKVIDVSETVGFSQVAERVPLVLSRFEIRLGWGAYSCTTLMEQYHLVLTPDGAMVRARKGKGSKYWCHFPWDSRVWDVSINPR